MAAHQRLFGKPEGPRKIGRYTVLNVIGQGGMGTVFQAYDPSLGRDVALKLVHQCGNGTTSAMVVREARALARLCHPNVVSVFEVGQDRGRNFIAMEHVLGDTLAQWLDRDPPLAQIISVFIDAGEGLAAAHAANLVHRDFKPSNVLIGNDGRVRVTDFGVAFCITRSEADISLPDCGGFGAAKDNTLGDSIRGTVPYMSPEALTGHVVDARSDQYAYCVSLFQALYKIRPLRIPLHPGAPTAEVGLGH